MPTLPIPLVVALLLAFVFLRAWATVADRREHAFYFVLLGVCIVHAAVVGLRWGFGMTAAAMIQPVLGSLLPPLAWLSFTFSQSADSARVRGLRLAAHALPVVVVLLLKLIGSAAIDPVLGLIYAGYGTALLIWVRGGPDTLVGTRLEMVISTLAAVRTVAIALIVSALLDGIVALELAMHQRATAAMLVGMAHLGLLLLIGGAVTVVGGSQPPVRQSDRIPTSARSEVTEAIPDTDESKAVLARIEVLMRDDKLYRDPDLSLSRLARRSGIPSRQVSAAINACLGLNVSQYVNGQRIGDAGRQLIETELPITTILLDAGFRTKSNFNREFLRVTGMTPTQWREARGADPASPLA